MKLARILTAVLLPAALLLPVLAQDDADTAPFDTGLSEETGVSLTFVDVEVLDAEGRPVPELETEDFEIFLNLRKHEVYSVDDLCACAAEALPQLVADTLKPSFVLYFDLSQLLPQGAEVAVAEARRWVRESMRAGDEAMLVAYGSRSGLNELASWTGDRKALEAGLDRLEALAGPTEMTPFEFASNREDCGADRNGRLSGDPHECYFFAMEEYFHGRRSLRALLAFLTTLQSDPQRKEMLLFHQNTLLDPKDAYGGSPFADEATNPVNRVSDHVELLDEVAGTAMVARTAIHPVFVGPAHMIDLHPEDVGQSAVNFGANLAEFTGGQYNLGPNDLAATIDPVGRGCPCVYRIGIEPIDPDGSQAYRMRVDAAGRTLDRNYRVQFLSGVDRWLRKAEAVLLDPQGANDVPVSAALVPVRCGKKGWEVTVQVAFDPEALLLVPEGPKVKGNWEIGAFLAESEGRKSWDMLGVSQLRGVPGSEDEAEGQGTPAAIVHERNFAGLKPRRYEVRAFVRDRWADVYGGAMAVLDLPEPGKAGLVGPLLFESTREHVVSPLPMRGKGGVETASLGRVQLALGGRAVAQGEQVEFHTWVCPGTPGIAEPERYVARRDERIPLGSSDWSRAGQCRRLTDTLDTGGLPAGQYAYRLSWNPGEGREPLATEAAFSVVDVATAAD